MIKKVSEHEFDIYYGKFNKLCLSDLTFQDTWNKSNSIVVRKIIRNVDKKVIGFIVNWKRFYICGG